VHHTECQENSYIGEDIYEEGLQPLEEEQDFSHDSTKYNEYLIEEASHEDEVVISSPPFDETIQAFLPPTQQKVNMVSYFPFKYFDDALFFYLKSE